MSQPTYPYDNSIPDTTLLTPHPTLQEILTKRGIPKTRPPTLSTLTPYRLAFSTANTRFNTSPLITNITGNPSPSTRYWSETDHTIPARDSHPLPIRIYKPHSLPQSGVPVVVLFHGGGWIMGDLETEASLARLFTAKLGVCVVNVAFRNYPEAKFGQSCTDCHDAARWVAKNIGEHGGNCELGFILAGVSGGGTYASIVAHLARDEGLTPRVTGQWLSCPVLSLQTLDESGMITERYDTQTVNRSWEQCRDAPLMNRAMSEAITAFAEYDMASQLFSPFVFKDHDGLGDGGVYVQVAGIDPWRDGGRIYAGLCGRSGRTRVDVYPGLFHCWWTSFPGLRVSVRWVEDSVRGLRWLLEGKGGKL